MKPRARTDFTALIREHQRAAENLACDPLKQSQPRKARSKSTAMPSKHLTETSESPSRTNHKAINEASVHLTEADEPISVVQVTENDEETTFKPKGNQAISELITQNLVRVRGDLPKEGSDGKHRRASSIQPLKIKDGRVRVISKNALEERVGNSQSIVTERRGSRMPTSSLFDQEAFIKLIRSKAQLHEKSPIQTERVVRIYGADVLKTARDTASSTNLPQITVKQKTAYRPGWEQIEPIQETRNPVNRVEGSRRRNMSFDRAQEQHVKGGDCLDVDNKLPVYISNKSVLDTSVESEDSVDKKNRREAGESSGGHAKQVVRAVHHKHSLDKMKMRSLIKSSVMTETSTDTEAMSPEQNKFRKRHKLFPPDVYVFRKQLKLQEQRLKERKRYDEILNRDIRPIFEKLHVRMDGYLVTNLRCDLY